MQVTTAARACQLRAAPRRARRLNALRVPHARANARRKRAPARAQAKPSTHGTPGTALRRGAGATWDYTYDLAGRLQTVQLNGTAYETYTYDPNGNRLSVAAPGGTTAATYDDQDRLVTYGPWTYTYTANGELDTKTNGSQTWSYDYDVFGNLKRVELPSGDIITYVVDGQNRRVGKKRNGTLEKQWLYGDQLHPVVELDGSGALVARFVWASGKNTPDLVITGGVTYRLFTDQLGSPRLLVNAATGAVGGVMRHDAWGVVLEDTASGLMPFGFAGGLYDGETGLVRFGARDYDPTVGRWVSKDPIGFRGGQANVYVYVGDEPINGLDPQGLWDQGPLGGKCCNSSLGTERAIVDGGVRTLGPGECTGFWDDCDGMTCGGGFYKIQAFERGDCDFPGNDDDAIGPRRWSPLCRDSGDDKQVPPGFITDGSTGVGPLKDYDWR